jgi:hypothetical protein
MIRLPICLSALAFAAIAGSASGQGVNTPPATGPAPAVIAPPAPDLKPGAVVIDRNGLRIGKVQSLAESERGAMVVVDMDGKLVSVPQSTLLPKGDSAVSSQSKDEILGAAHAPP